MDYSRKNSKARDQYRPNRPYDDKKSDRSRSYHPYEDKKGESSRSNRQPSTSNQAITPGYNATNIPVRNERNDDREGAYTLYPDLNIKEISVDALVGTHASVASTFTDGKEVQDTIDQLVANPKLAQSDAFQLTVFQSTRPGDPQGQPLIWSMNNRRLKALQEAQKQLAQKGESLPNIRIKWASKDDRDHALRAGAFNNREGGPVQYHNINTKVQRLNNTATLKDEKAIDKQTKQLEKLQKKKGGPTSDDYKDLFGF